MQPTYQRNRTTGRTLAFAGGGAGAIGGLALVIGGVLPWAQFAVFGISVALPGVVFAGGAVAALAGGGALFYGRRWPLLAAVLGLVGMAAGLTAQATVGREVVKNLLHIQNALAPVNARLADATLPPVDPFPSILPQASYVGPGPVWAFWGGAALAVGATGLWAGERLMRTCATCGRAWQSHRSGVLFCPRCGAQAAPPTACIRCFAPLRRGDAFCVRCGEGAVRS